MSSMLFLDIDGVLNSVDYWRRCEFRMARINEEAIDRAAVERLNAIVDRTGCDLILSSAWRGLGRLDDAIRVQKVLGSRGFRHCLNGCTPFLGADRHVEIGEVIDGLQPARFVVLDDDADAWCDGMAGWGRFVKTDYRRGLLDEHVEQAVEWLAAAAPGVGNG